MRSRSPMLVRMRMIDGGAGWFRVGVGVPMRDRSVDEVVTRGRPIHRRSGPTRERRKYLRRDVRPPHFSRPSRLDNTKLCRGFQRGREVSLVDLITRWRECWEGMRPSMIAE